ncbi:TetR/AcrR family transcriptional regulator [Mycolicibacterium brumae]|uniref:TetR/AcrR family transcriptional regulator n=1 Tax=Mycolicibacterium brumae TaxID=85968 RepID=A0A2G5PAY1_9MYCO|nr:TetR/AcrR family transcriptional regulator [Mycolicibacterium brumae]MCV7192123.1 TetR/AcrR family transcriptional regulator [Mycolicibacterium brumae]PIB75417.1 TetR/AcrR family transcriptional regulator [Mycolicibacterium brumae]RWA20788.1 hypothetical protein MBRU_03755 [Mycolicibacterium brumae DSM 44177]UWW07886.1 TetR/AcrR family transcriptional regulator [Mycolicibacterium brumae]
MTTSPALSGYEERWREHNDERRTQVLEATIELIEQSPPDVAVSVADIARRAGLAKSVVYRQFGGKEELERRARSLIVEDFAQVLDASLDLEAGSLRDILTRTVAAVADWMLEHPRLNTFVRSGPTFEGDGALDAVSELKNRMIVVGHELIDSVAQLVGADPAPFQTVPFAVITMVEATLYGWVRGVAPNSTREEIVADLADYVWCVIDGRARMGGVVLQPDEPFAELLVGLTAGRSSDGRAE